MEKLQFQKQVLGASCAHGFFEEDGLPGFKTACFKSKEEANTLARRLVAAYNATRHVPVETLETDPLTLDGVEDTFNRLKAQNAQLLEALEEIAAERDQYSVRAIAKHAISAATSTEKAETP